MDNWNTAHGLFGYELASSTLLALVVHGVLKKKAATLLISDCLNHLCEVYPDLRQELREIAAKNTAQIELLTLEVELKRKNRDS